MALTDFWTPEELERFAEQQERRREINRQRCQQYQARKRMLVIQKLGGKCSNCGEDDPDLLQIDEHDKTHSWSPRYGDILDGGSTSSLLCVKCNWTKRKILREDTGRPRASA